MSHPVELIDQIVTLLQREYPTGQFTFITEKAIPGTRMYPDIQIRDLKGQIVCVAEIGYTRPEKLTSYRKKLKIPDVRWYDKGGNLHGDVQERVVSVRVEIEPSGWFVVYKIDDMVECRSPECQSAAEMECGLDEQDLPLFPDEDLEFEKATEVSEFLCLDVCTLLVSDYSRVWFVCYCDKCGDIWNPAIDYSSDTEAIAVDLESDSPRDFAASWGGRKFEGDWKRTSAFVENYLGVKLMYPDGDFLTRNGRQEFNQSMSQIRAQAQRVTIV